MVDVDGLTDAELRMKLMEFGFPVMPITGTTRKVMVKKLKLLLDTKKKGGHDGRRSLSRYSSEEESDSDVKTKKNKRMTMGVPSEIKTSRRTRLNDTVTNDVQEKPKDVVSTKRTTTTTRTFKVQDEYETGSDSEPEVIEVKNDSVKKTNNSYDFKRVSPIRSTNYEEKSTTSTFAVPSTSSYSTYSSMKPPTPSPSRFSTYSPAATTGLDTSLDRLNQIRSRLSLGSPLYERPAYTSPISPSISDDDIDHSETPFLSNFTRRLSQLSSTPKPDYDYKNDVIKEHDANGASYNRGYLGRAPRYRDYARDYRPARETAASRSNLVSLVVVGVALLFFLAIGVMYVGMRSDSSALDTAGYVVPYCVASDPKAHRGVNCVIDGDVEDALRLMKLIKPELARRTISVHCDDSGGHAYMSEEEVVGYAHKHMTKDIEDIEQALNVLEILSFKNPEWDISIVVPSGDYVTDEDVLTSMDETVEVRADKKIALAVLHVEIPWRCTAYNKLHAVFNSIIVIVGGVAFVYASHYAYKYYRERSRKASADVYGMVERIVDALQSNASDGEDNFLVINHVRDMLLPLSERKNLESVWEKAVKFIRDNESRVRTEVQVVQGEPYEVWRWLGNPNLSTSGGSPRSKTWQGQAFETNVGSVNSLPCSPTPCLKIRGMVDDNDDNNYESIKEAVLSKVADKCRVLHCAVDVTTKCVYLKCADQGEAAVAYRNLHGWWYAGHLVTVKYLRLERYMQRFPDSLTIGPPFLKARSPATDYWTT